MMVWRKRKKMTKKIVKPVQSKDIAIGERIKKENLSKPIKDFLERKERTESEKLQDELEPIDENI